MVVVVTKVYGEVVSAFTWSRDEISGISFAKAIAKEKGYMNPKIFIA